MWYLVVIAGAEEDAAAGGVPLDQAHPSAVAVELQHRLRHVAPQPALWDLPYSHLSRSCAQKHVFLFNKFKVSCFSLHMHNV